MTERAYITVDWGGGSPRLVEVDNTSVINQDLHDSLKSNSQQSGEAVLENIDDDVIIVSSGKQTLPDGSVGITSELQDAQVAFVPAARGTPLETGTETTGGSAEVLNDSAATFITNGVERGDAVINWDDRSWTEVLEVVSETQLICRPLQGGTADLFNLNDNYTVFDVIQCTFSGGNQVAVDDMSGSINPVFPTLFTQAVIAQSSSPTLTNAGASDFWDALIADFQTPGSFGELVGKKLLTFTKWLALR